MKLVQTLKYLTDLSIYLKDVFLFNLILATCRHSCHDYLVSSIDYFSCFVYFLKTVIHGARALSIKIQFLIHFEINFESLKHLGSRF